MLKITSIILMVWGVFGIFMSSVMFGDIGFTAFIAGLGSLLSGFGLLQVDKKLK